MLSIDQLRPGVSVDLPELSNHVPGKSITFTVQNIFAGGMGVCAHLRHNDTGLEFALKGVRPDLIAVQKNVDRFLDELQVWLSASSCNLIAEALAVVRINEIPCVLATWMPQGDLAHALPRMPTVAKLESLLRIVRGLSWVKTNLEVIHRDLKPSNILLDAENLAYVADWGLARPITRLFEEVDIESKGIALDRPDRTIQGSFLGTVLYAAPEQITGARDIDHRADIYAIGCLMFEFETGTPPFQGNSIAEIARQHLQDKPKKLGGWLTSTNLGLERIIAKCLEKSPDARYANYNELESDLLAVMRKKGVNLDRCAIGTRYTRAVLGKGTDQQAELFRRAQVVQGTDDLALVELDDIAPFLEEANNLLALGRATEAERLLSPYIIPEILKNRDWLFYHSVATAYSLSLTKSDRAAEAEEIFTMLAQANPKPAEFFANYSLTLLALQHWHQASNICQVGLKQYPNDIDILGNLTIAYSHAGEHELAIDTALERLRLRRDIHSIEEAAAVIIRHAQAARNSDLPRAIEVAKTAGALIKEGISLNPNFYHLRLLEIALRRFAHDGMTVASLTQAMYLSESCPLPFRRLAFIALMEEVSETDDADSVLALIQKSEITNDPKLKTIELRVLARSKMIGRQTNDGKRVIVKEIVDHFLPHSSSIITPDPILAAELQEWLGDQQGAIASLTDHLAHSPNDWKALRLMSLLQMRHANFVKAVAFASLLVKCAPWRAESYDCLVFVAERANDTRLVNACKSKGDEVFAEENRLFAELRASLDQ